MFGPPKPAFGQPTSTFGFGSPTAGALPFGTPSAFGKPASAAGVSGAFGSGSTAFGAGANTAGGALFGSAPNQSAQSSGLFGSPATANQTGFGNFGQPATSGLFANNAGSTLFNQTASAPSFGSKPPGFGGFGNPSSGTVSGNLFGSPQPAPGIFGQPASTTPTGGLFGATTGFGAPQMQQSGTVIKYNPVPGTDVMLRNGQSTSINIKHHCITCMKEYETKSLEELRLEDYMAGRRGPQNPTATTGLFSATNTFGSPSGGTTAFGNENKPGLFGQPTGFGQPSNSATGGLFGKPATSGFGTTPGAFSFGGATSTAGAAPSLFGSSVKPFGVAATPGVPGVGTGLFGTQPAQQASAFGAPGTAGAFGFGAPTNQTQNTALFGAQTSTAGGFGPFGASTIGQQQPGGLFGAKPVNAIPFGTGALGGFGTAAPNTFGAPTSAPSLFGGANAFGAKPITATTGFGGFGAQQPGTTGLGVGLTGLGSNTTGLFGGKPGGLGTGPTGLTMGGPTFSSGTNTGLGTSGGGLTGLGGFGTGTLGQNNPSLFGPTYSGFGGNTNTGLSMGTGLGLAGNNYSMMGQSHAPSGVNIHEHMMNLVAGKPYGDCPLLKGLEPSLGPMANDLTPTNPAAQMALLNNSLYKVSSSRTANTGLMRALPPPRALSYSIAKKSLFDGLEEDDPSLEEKLTLKHNHKRLILRRVKPMQVVDPLTASNRVSPLADTNQRDGDRLSNRLSDVGQPPSAEEQSRPNESLTESPSAGANVQRRAAFSTPSSTSSIYVDTSISRRTNWLMPKPLKTAASPLEAAGSLEDTIAELCVPRAEVTSPSLYPSLAHLNRSGLLDLEDKENIDSSAAAEESSGHEPSYEPHPTGIKLTRPGYYTVPTLDELIGYIRTDGSCVVPQFTVGRRGYGHVFYNCEMDVAGLDLDDLVHFLNKEVEVYPDDSKRPTVGHGLNRRAQVTLDRVWPRDKTARCHITDPERLESMGYEGKLRNVCDKHNTKFIEYRPQTGSWVFKVEHFSKYGLSDSDGDDEVQPGCAPQPPGLPKPPLVGMAARQWGPVSQGLQGLGGLLEDQEMAMDGMPQPRGLPRDLTYKTLAMDNSEENSNESTTLYPEGDRTLSHGQYTHKSSIIISATSELARLDRRSSHSVQLMKASLYNRRPSEDVSIAEEDRYSLAAGDQLVPQPASPHIAYLGGPKRTTALPQTSPPAESTVAIASEKPALMDLLAMAAPLVQPKVVTLKRQRGVVPYNRSIAARINASCPPEEALSLGRKFRVCLSAAGRIVLPATTQWATNQLKESTLYALSDLTDGRDSDDYTNPVIVYLRMAGGGPQTNQRFRESIEPHLEVCLRHSVRLSPEEAEDANASAVPRSRRRQRCPQFTSDLLPETAASLLKDHNLIARTLAEKENAAFNDQNCLTARYSCEVWSLCNALWGLHLEPTEEGLQNAALEARNRHEALSRWLAETVAPTVDAELKKGGLKLEEDGEVSEAHCASILTLLTGRRLLESCRVAINHNDHMLALIISQIGGDAAFRSLLADQLSAWCKCSASDLVGRARGAILLLATGSIHWPQFQPRYAHLLDWLRAFAVHYWYVCPTLSTASEAVTAYEKSLLSDVNGNMENTEGNDAMNITLITPDDYDQQTTSERYAFPTPPYGENFHVEIRNGEQRRRRITDLRYALLQIAAGRSLGSVGDATLPASYTMDPLDYRLSWLVQIFLWSAGVSRSAPSERTSVDFATQLESRGMWHWALYVLLFIDDEDRRTRLVRELLFRCVGSGDKDDPTKEQLAFVRDQLQVPESWLRLAQAQRARYENKPVLEAEHLVAAEEWNAAHRLVLERIIPEAVLADDLKSLESLLVQMSSAAERNEVFGWETGGRALHNYIRLYAEINEAATGADVSSDELRAMLRRASALAAVLPAHPSAGLNAIVARCELSSRLSNLAYRVLSLTSSDDVHMNGDRAVSMEDTTLTVPAAQALVQIISKLDLPVDYIHNILSKCVEALGDDAGESAAEILSME